MIMRNKPDNEYTVKDLAEILDVSARTIKNWEKKGTFLRQEEINGTGESMTRIKKNQ